jgi:hypothetical protein
METLSIAIRFACSAPRATMEEQMRQIAPGTLDAGDKSSVESDQDSNQTRQAAPNPESVRRRISGNFSRNCRGHH